MDTKKIIALKYQELGDVLKKFSQAISHFTLKKEKHNKLNLGDEEDIEYTIFRDAIIVRFEFSVELFWRYLRLYLEEHEKIEVKINTPRAVIRTAVQARLITEDQAIILMNMIETRILTIQSDQEEIAEQLAHDLPHFYELMNQLTVKLKP